VDGGKSEIDSVAAGFHLTFLSHFTVPQRLGPFGPTNAISWPIELFVGFQ